MANVVRQSHILSKVVTDLAAEFGYPVYSDEVLEKFKKPCFFITASSTMNPQSVNWMKKELTLQLTYYAKDSEKNEIAYMDVIDRVQQLFQVGIQVDDRYLHIESIEDDRAGEEQDILTITIIIPFLEQVVKPASSAEIMEELDMEVHHNAGRPDEEVWNDIITDENV